MNWPSLQVITNIAAWLGLGIAAVSLYLARRDKHPRLKIRIEVKDPDNIRGVEVTERTIVVLLSNPSETDVHLVSAHIPIIGKKRFNLSGVPPVVPARGWKPLTTSEGKVREFLKAERPEGNQSKIQVVVEAASGKLYKSRLTDLDKFHTESPISQ